MHAERWLQIAVATLAALATVMLGMGEGEPLLPTLAVIVSISSVYMTDVTGWIRLRGPSANLAAAAAVLFVLWNSSGMMTESRLLEMSHILVYLQFILLYQQKNVRRFWLLIVVSLVETAVAAALNTEPMFGLVIVAYLLVGIIAVSLLFLHCELRRHGQMAEKLPQPAEKTKPSASPLPSRWPLERVSSVLPSGDERQTWREAVGWEFLRRSVSLWFATLGLTALVFVVMPRLRETAWDRTGPANVDIQQTGVSENVSLGTFGEILESPEGVMRVQFFPSGSKEPMQLVGEPLFRGFHLRSYRDGHWAQPRGSRDDDEFPAEPEENVIGLVKQETTIEPLNTSLLFCVHPPRNVVSDRDLLFDPGRNQIRRDDRKQQNRFNYQFYTEGVHEKSVMSTIPVARELDRPQGNEFLDLPDDWGPDSTVARLAAEVVANAEVEGRRAEARALERYLRDSGDFGYSLKPPASEEGRDLIVSFLDDHRTGHCEYFASALVLLLRARGIPARMVVGYKGGEYNAIGDFYLVRQLHAHAWVEAYLEPDELPRGLPFAESRWTYGGWMLLDPTPGVGKEVVIGGWLSYFPALRQLTDYLQFVWTSYIVGLNRERQMAEIYGPMVSAVKQLFMRSFWQKAAERLPAYIASGEWFNWRAGLLGMMATAILIGLWRLFRWLPGTVVAWYRRRWRATTSKRRVEVEFYRRLEQLLARARWTRRPIETPREFADFVRGTLARSPTTVQVASAPADVVEAYYRVRFGRQTLDHRRAEAVQRALDRLEAALDRRSQQDGKG